jgi:DNA-binding PadR family transcriptional regulator
MIYLIEMLMRGEELEELISDFARFYILTILYESGTHGYGIIQKFQERLGRRISPGIVYPFLQKLEERGLIAYRVELVGEKERKVYELTEEGRTLCHRLFRRFAELVSTALEPSLYVCAHCGCKLYSGGYREIIDGVETSFCCVHCAQAYKDEMGVGA